MTYSTFVPSRPDGVADERSVLGTIASLRGGLRQYRTYRRTVAELNALSIRQREDLGFAGLDLGAVARDAIQRA